MRHFSIRLVALFIMLASCDFVERVVYDDEIVARVGKAVLRKSDVEKMLSPGMDPGDSARAVARYAGKWRLEQLMLRKAEAELPKQMRDVSQELESYRRSLLVYRYEQMYVQSRLDTAVGDTELQEYYMDNRDAFISSTALVRGYLVRMRTDSPNLRQVRHIMENMSDTDFESMEAISTRVSYGYSNFCDLWVSAADLARELGTDVASLERALPRRKMEESMTDSTTVVMLRVWEYIPRGEVMPFDYCRASVRERIVSKRKAELLKDLERELLRESEF